MRPLTVFCDVTPSLRLVSDFVHQCKINCRFQLSHRPMLPLHSALLRLRHIQQCWDISGDVWEGSLRLRYILGCLGYIPVRRSQCCLDTYQDVYQTSWGCHNPSQCCWDVLMCTAV